MLLGEKRCDASRRVFFWGDVLGYKHFAPNGAKTLIVHQPAPNGAMIYEGW
jgi:hypothetical protein